MVAVFVAMSCALPLPIRAEVWPSLDPDTESILVDEFGLSSNPLPGARGAIWLASGGRAQVAEGTVRARARIRRGLRETLLFRARVEVGRHRVEEGYGLAFDGIEVGFVRIEAGKRRFLGTPTRLDLASPQATLEVVLTFLGQRAMAALFDASTGRELALIDATGLEMTPGRVGWIVGARGGLQLLTVRTACMDTPVFRDVGPFLTVSVPSHEELFASRFGVGLERLDGAVARVVFRTNIAGLEGLYCGRHELTDVTTTMPWKYRDPNYLSYRDRPPVLTRRGFALDRSYKNPQMVEALLKGWHQRYPDKTRLERIGTSWEGRPIWALAISDEIHAASDRPAVLLNGAHHGGELLSVEFVLDAISVLLDESGDDPRTRSWLQQMVVWCVPVVNPDGLHGYMESAGRSGRKNGRDFDGDGHLAANEGVDLNRNYPFRWGALAERGSRSEADSRYYRGPAPASEPETRAIMKLASRERFVASLSYHTGAVAILAPYTIDGVKNPRRNEAWAVALELAAQLEPHPQRREFEVKRKLYAVDGVDQDWHRFSHGTLALLVEGARWSPQLMQDRSEIVEVVRPTWMLLLDRFVHGPAVSLHIVDVAGRPVTAEVQVSGLEPRESERWTTRCRDGFFGRYLPRRGTYRVKVIPQGQPPVERVVHVGDVRAEIVVELQALVESDAATVDDACEALRMASWDESPYPLSEEGG